MESNELVIDLASYAHSSWSGWMNYLFSRSDINEDGSVTIPKELVERWMRQMNTDYNDLSEEEKKSDKKEAYRMISTFISFLDRMS